MVAIALAALPDNDDLLRVHWQPAALYRPPHELDAAAMSRFDDSYREFAVRYLASTLRGCLVETMSRFRPAPGVEAVLANVDGIQEGDPDPTRENGLQEWLAEQQVGHCCVDVPEPCWLMWTPPTHSLRWISTPACARH